MTAETTTTIPTTNHTASSNQYNINNNTTNSNNNNKNNRIFFFDIDNCLYHKNLGIATLMGQRIRDYFKTLGLDSAMAEQLHQRYYIDYGLAIRGLVKHHQVDPVEYDKIVDGGLPLDEILKPDPELRAMLSSMNGIRKWACTNAGIAHATRVLKLLNVHDLFEGITYCDYSAPDFICKPERAFYEKTMRESGASHPSHCWFVDDSGPNVDAAKEFGWTTVHVADSLDSTCGHFQILDVKELPKLFPEFWS